MRQATKIRDAAMRKEFVTREKTAMPGPSDLGRPIIPMDEAECVWAGAGVIPYKLCDSHFNCTECAFDLVMRGAHDLTPSWVKIGGCKVCPFYFYHRCHTWAKVEEKGNVRIGLDDLAVNLLGEITAITLPDEGEKIGRESILVKGRGEVMALVPPVEGHVVEGNPELTAQPGLAGRAPYSKGWLVLVRPVRLSVSLRNLYYGLSAQRWFEAEMHRVHAVLAETMGMDLPEVGTTCQDGGDPCFDMIELMVPAQALEILKKFLHYAKN